MKAKRRLLGLPRETESYSITIRTPLVKNCEQCNHNFFTESLNAATTHLFSNDGASSTLLLNPRRFQPDQLHCTQFTNDQVWSQRGDLLRSQRARDGKRKFSTLAEFLTEHSNVASNSTCGTAASPPLKTTGSSRNLSVIHKQRLCLPLVNKILGSVLSPFHGALQSRYQQIPERQTAYWTAKTFKVKK